MRIHSYLYKDINICVKYCSPEKVALLATEIAIEMSKGKDIAELNLIRNITLQVGAVIQTIIIQKINLDTKHK